MNVAECRNRPRSNRPVRRAIELILLSGILLGILSVPARAQFRDLLAKAPYSANSVVILNMEKIKASPMGVREGWAKGMEKAFASGLSRVPPKATRFVLAAQIDFEFMNPVWEMAVGTVAQPVSLEELAKARGGIPDTVEGLAGAALPNNVFAVQFDPTTVGAMAPSNRQAVVRWLRDLKSTTNPQLSPYLKRAAGYSDEAGTEIIMAIDLDGAVQLERVHKKLKEKEFLKEAKVDVAELSRLALGIQGVRVGVRIKETPFAAIAIDFRGDVSALEPVAKPLFLSAIADQGMMIDDLQRFQASVKGSTVTFSGELSTGGLRRLLSVVESPSPSEELPVKAEGTAGPSATELAAQKPEASRKYFQAVTGLFDDLKNDMKEAKNLASTTVWFDRYAKKIDRMPILNVDEELIEFGGFVAAQLRNASGAMRTMGIRSNQRQSQYQYAYGNTGSGYAYNGNGGYGSYGFGFGPGITFGDAYAGMRQVSADRRVVKSEEKAIAATDVYQIRDQVAKAASDMRRKMTEKYQIEF